MSTVPERVAPDILDLARRISTATLTSQLQKRGFANTFMLGVQPLRPELRLAGQAFTLRFIPMREDIEPPGETDNRTSKQRLAVEAVGPGDVLVIDARGDVRAATLGDILATRIKQRGAAGIVTDGAFRDTPSIRALERMQPGCCGQSNGLTPGMTVLCLLCRPWRRSRIVSLQCNGRHRRSRTRCVRTRQ